MYLAVLFALLNSHPKVLCFGEKGILRVFFAETLQETDILCRWDSHKATGALPSLSGFGVALGDGSVIICGGKPFLGKEGDMHVFMLDTGFLSAPNDELASPKESFRDSVGGGNTVNAGKKDKHKYATLRGMFSRKSIDRCKQKLSPSAFVLNTFPTASSSSLGSSMDKNVSQMSPTTTHISSANNSPNMSSPSTKTRKFRPPMQKVMDTLSPKDKREEEAGKSHQRKKSIGDSSVTQRKNSIDVHPDSLPAFQAPQSLKRADSGNRFEDLRTSRTSEDSYMKSPTTSPGRNDQKDDLEGIGGIVADLKKQLELERKKSAALKEEMEKFTGSGDASVLVRRALDEEVKRTQQLRNRVENLEKEASNDQAEKQMMRDQSERLKKVISDQGSTVKAMEKMISERDETIKECVAKIGKLEHLYEVKDQLTDQLAEERVSYLTEVLKNKKKDSAIKELYMLFSFTAREYPDMIEEIFQSVPKLRHQFESRLEEIQDFVDINQEKCLKDFPMLKSGGKAQTHDTVDSSEVEGSESLEVESGSDSPTFNHHHKTMPKLPLHVITTTKASSMSPKNSSRNTPMTPHFAENVMQRHNNLLKELEHRNTLELPSNYPRPTYDLVLELNQSTNKFKGKLIKANKEGKSLEDLMSETIVLENDYLNSLKSIDGSIYAPLRDSGLLSEEMLASVFTNLPLITVFHAELLESLFEAKESEAFFGAFAAKASTFLDLYETYMENLGNALECLESVNGKKIHRILAKMRAPNSPRVLDMTSILIKPLIHLCCYLELFVVVQSVSKDVPTLLDISSNVHKSLNLLVEMCREKLDQLCSNTKLRQIESNLLYGEDYVDLSGKGRVFVDEMSFVVVETEAGGEKNINLLNVVLFNDFLLMIKKSGNSDKREPMVLYELIPLQLLKVREFAESDESNIFVITNKAKPSVTYSMIATTPLQAKQWHELLKQAGTIAYNFFQSRTEENESSISSSSSGWLLVEPKKKSEFVDSDEICYSRDAVNGKVTVRGGKPKALITWLINDISGPNASEEVLQFLQSSPKFISPQLILDTAMELFESATERPKKIRALLFFSIWTQEFCLRDLMTTYKDEKGEEGLCVRHVISFS